MSNSSGRTVYNIVKTTFYCGYDVMSLRVKYGLLAFLVKFFSIDGMFG